MNHRARLSILGTCAACVAAGIWESLQGHFHHAWPLFAAAWPGWRAFVGLLAPA